VSDVAQHATVARLAAVETGWPRRLRVGILDRDSGLLVGLVNRMQRLGWEHRVLPRRSWSTALTTFAPDVLVLDVMELGERRWSSIGAICRKHPDLGLLICTAQSTPAERVAALRMGADDWLAKPCHPEELLARAQAIGARLRRFEMPPIATFSVGEIEVRGDQYQAFLHGRSLGLTRREHALLELLCRGRGEVQRREHIYERLWGAKMARDERSVDVLIYKLRRKLEQAAPHPRYIHTHHGVGYSLATEPIAELPAFEHPPAETLLVA
jgi:DNA-binding response OmpR family regulator